MSEFQIDITEISEVERDVRVIVPQAFIDQRYESLLDELADGAQVKGFRKGKVPRKVVAKMYNKRILQDIEQEVVQEGYRQAIEDNKMPAVALPSFKREDLKKGTDYSFSFMVEVRPEIKEVIFEGVEVERERVEVSDERLDQELERRRQDKASMKSIEGRDVTEDGDWVSMDYEAFKDGEAMPGSKKEKDVLQLGGNQLIPGFEQNVIGKKIGEEFEFTLPFPEDFRVPELAGTELSFQATVHEIMERIVPELDDEFAKDMGDYDDLNQYRIAVREELEKNEEERVTRAFHNELWKKLSETNKMALPPSLVKEEAENLFNSNLQQMVQQGLDPKVLGLDESIMRERAKEEAEFNLISAILQEKLAADMGVTVSDEEVDEHLAEMAARFGLPVEQLKAYYSANENLEGIRFGLRQTRLAEMLTDKVNVVEVDPKPMNVPGAITPANAEEKASAETEAEETNETKSEE